MAEIDKKQVQERAQRDYDFARGLADYVNGVCQEAHPPAQYLTIKSQIDAKAKKSKKILDDVKASVFVEFKVFTAETWYLSPVIYSRWYGGESEDEAHAKALEISHALGDVEVSYSIQGSHQVYHATAN